MCMSQSLCGVLRMLSNYQCETIGVPTSSKDRQHDICNLVASLLMPRRKTTFQALVEALYGSTVWHMTRGRAYGPCERVALTLYRLGQGASVRATAALFELSEGAVTELTMRVVALICEKLLPEVVQWPTLQEQERIASEWEAEKLLR